MNRSFSSSKIRESRNGRNQAHRSLCTTKPTVRIFYLDSIRLLIFVYFDLEMILTSFFTLNPPTLQHARLQITTRPVFLNRRSARFRPRGGQACGTWRPNSHRRNSMPRDERWTRVLPAESRSRVMPLPRLTRSMPQWLVSLRTRSPPAPVTRQLRDFKLRRPSPPWTRVGDGPSPAGSGSRLGLRRPGPPSPPLRQARPGTGLAGLVTVTESVVLHSG